ncbi:hypothetical protein AZI85_15110 [Bdellovibrio bacteriovorus]|uniref:Peptidase S1 domain-containing protein n=1 Tax=Bdellovibrio bacteriovorus TaxID=959 RepID=A0A150WU61_BDEBC|nr:trypsin-like serine protease [Bdellovibrio bacteriovorus]KYG70019.1 hypothetical protein AZI85_15110 [Bdellovibrio bacteriovorus]
MNTIAKLLVLLTTVFFVACAPSADDGGVVLSDTSAGIFGGDKVDSDERIAQSTVGIYNTEKKAICTGTLIAKNVVLTAAHCLVGSKSEMEIRFGTKISKGVSRKVVEALREPHYTNTIIFGPERDIALIKFAGSLPSGYRPINILNDFSVLTAGKKITVAGYGRSLPKMKMGEGTLRKTQLKILKPFYMKDEIQFDQSDDTGSCHGDSGGPAYTTENGELKVFGVTSKVRTTKERKHVCDGTVIYTRIDFHLPWVEKVLRDFGTLN